MKLHKNLSEKEFKTHYWYATDLKKFAKEIGLVGASKLRKDELEELILYFLKTGKIENSTRKTTTKSKVKDIEVGLSKSLPIKNYTSNKVTKQFIIDEASKMVENFKVQSGVWYRLNRWREEQLENGNAITYGDLIDRFIFLNQNTDQFEKIPSTLINNFISDYLTNEEGSTRKEAMQHWQELKKLKTEKTYRAWKESSNN
ncbi:SAP domain-containing protein [Riemerella columbina]|uniref:SAP domain-containing protein n=1 Tax=Riemerella columbina TaxID=103810 RepID=UPI00037B8CEA|nr:SAP domain-containing protein [Riemerella columbina]